MQQTLESSFWAERATSTGRSRGYEIHPGGWYGTGDPYASRRSRAQICYCQGVHEVLTYLNGVRRVGHLDPEVAEFSQGYRRIFHSRVVAVVRVHFAPADRHAMGNDTIL